MKNVLKIFVTVLLCGALFIGCSSEKNKDTAKDNAKKNEVATESAEEIRKKASEHIDMSNYAPSGEDGKSYSLRGDLMKDYALDGTVVLEENTTFSMPVEFTKFREFGWEPVSSVNTNISLNPGSSTDLECAYNGKKVNVYVTNITDGNVIAGESSVSRIIIELYGKEDGFEKQLDFAPQFVLCEKITNTSNMDDIIAALGEPTNLTYSNVEGKYNMATLLYQNISAYENIKFELTGDGSKIVRVDYNVAVK